MVSVTNQMAAKLAAQVANTETACPHQMTATRASQFAGSGLPLASSGACGSSGPLGCTGEEDA